MKSAKVLKSLLVLGLICSTSNVVVHAEETSIPMAEVEDNATLNADNTDTTTPTTEGVAKIGKVTYNSLAEAIQNVGIGETITLLKDVPDAEGMAVPSEKDFTIDFNGHTYTLTAPGAGSPTTETNGFQLLKDSTIVMKNGIIRIDESNLNVIPTESRKPIMRIIQNYANLTLENMQIYAENQYGGEDYALSFNNGNIHFKGNTSVYMTSSDTIAFDVCKFSSYPSAIVTFDDHYTGSIEGTISYDSSDSDTHKLVINGNGTFEKINTTDEAAEAAKTGISVNSGTFGSVDVLDYLAPNAEVNIKLNEDVNHSIVIPEGTTVHLDLNGNKITNTEGSHTITNNGTLTITGNGTVDNISHAKGALLNKGTVTIEGGNFTRSRENGQSPSDNGGNSWYVISNEMGGTMTFDGGSVISTGKFSSLVRNYGAMTINDGEFSNGFIAIKSEEDTTLDINGGNITGTQSLQTYGTTAINGGELNGQVTVINYETYSSKTEINGGKITGDVVGWLDSNNARVDVKFNGEAQVIGNVKVWDSNKNEISENDKVDVNVESGSFSSNVSDFVSENASYIKVDGVYHAGTETQVQKKAEKATNTVEVIKGVDELNNIPSGVTVTNNSGQNITVNDKTVANGETTITPKPVDPYIPSRPVDTSNVSAETLEGDKVKVKEVKTDKDLEKALLAEDSVLTTIEVGKADEDVVVTYKAGRKYKDETFYVVTYDEKLNKVIWLDAVEADEKGNVEIECEPNTEITLVKELKGWVLDEKLDYYFFDYETGKQQMERWVADGQDAKGNVNWYYLNEEGKLLTSAWIARDSKLEVWYYVNDNGLMLYDTTTPDGYYVDANGVWRA